MFNRTAALIDSDRVPCDDSSFSFGYGRNACNATDLSAVVRFFGSSFFAEFINGTGRRELLVHRSALREIDRETGHRAIVQLLKNDFHMFSARSIEVAALEELASAFFEDMGGCRIFSNTLIYSADHGGDCLGPWTPITRSTRDNLVCAVNKEHVAYWVYSDDE